MRGTTTGETTPVDWAAFDALRDEDIDTSDCPPLTAEMLSRMVVRNPGERLPAHARLTLTIDPEVAAWFARREDYQSEMAAALRAYMDGHRDEPAPQAEPAPVTV